MTYDFSLKAHLIFILIGGHTLGTERLGEESKYKVC